MKIAIMGAGPGGAYLYRLLRECGHEVKLFDLTHQTPCGIKPCAWATSHPDAFSDLCYKVGIEPPFLSKYDGVLMEGKMKAKSTIAMIDKPALLKRLLSGAKLSQGFNDKEFDRVIDATGYHRAYLGGGGSLFYTVQRRAKIDLDKPVAYLKHHGWVWVLPLGNGEAHIGAGSVRDHREAKKAIEEAGLGVGKDVCTCVSYVFRTGFREPFIKDRVWGLGEAIGLVDPITGEGIVPAMLSAKLMAENWNSPEEYERAIKKTFSMIPREARVAEMIFNRRPCFPVCKTFTNVHLSFIQKLRLFLKWVYMTSGAERLRGNR